MSGQMSLPRVDGDALRTVDLEDSWDRLLRRCGDISSRIGKTNCIIDLSYRAPDFSNALKDKDGHHLRGYDLCYLNINADSDEIAEEFAAQRGKRLADEDDESELARFQSAMTQRFGAAGAEFVAHWNDQRRLRKAVNVRSPKSKR